MSSDGFRMPPDGERRVRLIVTCGVFALVFGFVLTMKILGESPWDAITLIVGIGTAASTIAAGILAVSSSSRPSQPDKPVSPPVVEPKPVAELEPTSKPELAVQNEKTDGVPAEQGESTSGEGVR